ncbi:uncharacterized protein TOT_010001281 [Theileria orientalis strain Shintoku]|uniref:Rhoptry-associated protein n=1 Tax=Theileria orientalis strain Shintoku TaxID=869250 RepID=J4C7K1_THEOR|nr:uncharacterized protein TOT_010001281 [Theileria orientalis strain Shintoku]BAM39178.1 uncharacterized protein TOT_010001281 [Theileria orientalis strain Shintoku]|eukprot:XP_009689479.1 uncharacterized protein TOT_010001281 [Theileria orientalis strain Shintoku]
MSRIGEKVTSVEDAVLNSINEGANGLGNAAKQVLDSFSKGFNFFNDSTAQILKKSKEIRDTGVNLVADVEKGLEVPLRIVADSASGNMDLFLNAREALEKKEHINKLMSEHLKKHIVELPESKQGLLNDKYLKLYRDRCRAGDCLTLDNVTVVNMTNRVLLKLPRLAQVDYAFALFNQSGAQLESGLLSAVLRRTNYNSLDNFVQILAHHNQQKVEFLNKNDQALNLFYYRAALFFKKFLNDSKVKDRVEQSKTLTAALGYFVKSDLMEIAQVATLNANLSLEEVDMLAVNRNFKEYLLNDSEEFASLSEAYASLCKQCLEGSFDDNEAGMYMREALNEGKVSTEGLCDDKKCNAMLDKYLERCKRGDCYTFDNHLLTGNVRIKILMPHIPQAKLAMRAFKNSKAHRGKHLVGFLKMIFRMDSEKTLTHFVKTLTKHNVQLNYYNNEGEKVLNQFLYQATLFFVRFLTVSKLVRFYSWCNATLWMFKLGRYRYLRNLAKSITFGNKVTLAGDNVPLLMNDFEDYLVSSNLARHATISRYYSKMCKDVIMHYINADRMSTELFDAGVDVRAEDICGKDEQLECPPYVEKYLERCKKGDCYTFDSKDYFTHDRMYKLTLPILHQVEAAIYVFKKSKAYTNLNDRIVRVGKSRKNVDSYVQFYRNLITHNNKSIEAKTFENEVLNKYLYNSAVYFKFVDDNKVLDNIDVSHLQEYKDTEYKIESFLKRMLKSLVGVERVRFLPLDIKDLFSVYRKFFITTQVVKNERGVKVFLASCEKLLRHFKQMQNNDEMFRDYVKNFDNE